jgi:hypothetical protein
MYATGLVGPVRTSQARGLEPLGASGTAADPINKARFSEERIDFNERA